MSNELLLKNRIKALEQELQDLKDEHEHLQDAYEASQACLEMKELEVQQFADSMKKFLRAGINKVTKYEESFID